MHSDKFAKETIIRIGTQYALTITTIFAGIIIARALGPSDRGSLAIIILSVNLLQGVLASGMVQALWFFSAKNGIALEILWTLITAYSIVIGVPVAIGLVIIGQTGMYVFQGISLYDLILATTCLPIGLWVTTARPIIVQSREIRIINYIDLGQGVFYLGSSILFCIILNWGIRGGVVAYSIGIFASSIMVMALGRIQFSTDWKQIWQLYINCLGYGSKASIGLIAQTLNYRLDMFLINYFRGSLATGLYSISTSFSELILQFSIAAQTVSFSHFSNSTNEQQNKTITPIVRITLLFTIIMSFIWTLLGYMVIPIVFGKEYSDAIPASSILNIGMVGLSGVKVLYAYLTSGKGLPFQASMALVSGLIVTVVLDVLLIPRYGILGAAFASSVAYWLSFIVLLVMASQYSQQEWINFIRIGYSDFQNIVSFTIGFINKVLRRHAV